jgi:hypothetical protein
MLHLILAANLLLLPPQSAQEKAQATFDRAVADFFAGKVSESARGFDEVMKMAPASAPHLWQRGIALYYANRYEDCRDQFEFHRSVNPNDVENAAWHFLCVARLRNSEAAKRAVLPVGRDSRVPMREIYGMFKGEVEPGLVIKAAGDDAEAQFYARLYVGLYLEATGRSVDAVPHLKTAADDRFAAGGYMHRVAKVHVTLMQRASATDSETWVFDSVENIGGRPAKVSGNPRVIDAPGGKAIEFDGVDDAIFIDVHPLAGAATFTWEVIFRPDPGGSAEQRFFHLQERDSASGEDTQNRLLFETRLVGDNWYLDSFAHSGNASKALMRRDRLHPLGVWYHVAMVYDGKSFRNYVNGEPEGGADLLLQPQGRGRTSVGVRINLRDYFKGAVHKARFTRRALSPAEFMKLQP